jgi:hypothetical protein
LKIAEDLIQQEVTDSDVKRFLADMQKMVDKYHQKNFPNQGGILRPMKGKRYYRITNTNTFQGQEGQTSAWAFIDKTNGDILKPASWRAPAKHARANIFDKSSWRNIGPYGPAYLR